MMKNRDRWIAVLALIAGLQALVIALTYRQSIADRLSHLQSSKSDAQMAAPIKSAPAKVEVVQASDLKRVTLTARAAARLGIKLATVGEQSIERKRFAPGEIIAVPAITTVIATARSIVDDLSNAAPGSQLIAGSPVLRLTTLFDWREPANGTTVATGIAQASFETVTAPRDCTLVRLLVKPGQMVDEGQALFEIAESNKILVRVPFTSDLNNLNREESVHVRPINDGGVDLIARRIEMSAYPDFKDKKKDRGSSADPAGSELFFVVYGAGHGLVTGQRVRIEFSMPDSGMRRKVVPYSSVLYDAHGGAWVFTNPEPLVFVRHRISVDFIDGDLAVLADGPPTGAKLVTVGAAELLGAELRGGGS